MRTFFLSLLCLLPLMVRGANALTQTVQVAGVSILQDDFVLTAGKGYVHILLDTYRSRSVLDSAEKRRALALGILNEQLGARFAKMKKAKIDVVQFTERNNYGAPDWSSLIKQERYEGSKDKKGAWSLQLKK